MIRLCSGFQWQKGTRLGLMPSPCFGSRRPSRLPSKNRGVSRVASSTVQCNLEEPSSNGALGQLSLEALPALVLSAARTLTPLQIGVITAAGVVLAALARTRAAHCLLVVSTSRQALAGLPFPPSAMGPWIREDILMLGAGLTLLLCWTLWRVLKERIVRTPTSWGTPEQPPARPPPISSNKGESEKVQRLQVQLQQARQEANEAKHRLKALQQAWQESGAGNGSAPGNGSGGSQGPPPGQRSNGLELARAESKAGEARVARMEAQEAKEELAVMRQEVQELYNIVNATLEGISSDTGDEDAGAAQASRHPAEVAAGNGGNGNGGRSRLLAAATALQSKVALLKQRADAATALLEEKRRLQDKLREADVTIASLTQDIGSLKWEAQHAHYTIDSLQIHLQSSQKENRGLRAAATKAERHLDAYDKMVLRLEDQCEVLEEEREQLRARLLAMQGEGTAASSGANAGAGNNAGAGRGSGDSHAAWGLNGAGKVGAGSAAS